MSNGQDLLSIQPLTPSLSGDSSSRCVETSTGKARLEVGASLGGGGGRDVVSVAPETVPATRPSGQLGAG